MASHQVRFITQDGQEIDVTVRSGVTLAEAALQAGIELNIPCGGQGRCGRCAVVVERGEVHRRSTVRLSDKDIAAGYALACQTVPREDVVIRVPRQEKIERRLTSDKTAEAVELPFHYTPQLHQTIERHFVWIDPPSLADNTDDVARLRRTLAQKTDVKDFRTELTTLQRLSAPLREKEWDVTAVLEKETECRPSSDGTCYRLVDVLPGNQADENWGVAIDIGTTSNVVYLVDLRTGRVVQQAADYNGQIARGEDVISRIIYASKGNGLQEMQSLVLGTLNKLIERVCRRQKISPEQVHKATVAGNSTMMHLFLALPPQSIRLEPYITTVNHVPPARAAQIGLKISPAATVDCLPGVASYVGADITAGVVSSGMMNTDELTLFLDIGTNGEMVLGDGTWFIACACSAGPAFEGAGVQDGMRATEGAIEEIWINDETYEPSYRVIGGAKPKGICGSGLIGLLAEAFITGLIDKSGHFNFDLDTPRVRQGEHGGEYVVAWADETARERDIVLTRPDIDNLLRAKAAIYAGYASLAQSVGIDTGDVTQMLIGGAFGQYLNIEKAIQIGLLPDLPWDRFHFLGNTSVKGAYMALLRQDVRDQVAQVADMMTYLELSADNTFYEHFTAALFMPHTDMRQFPSVAELLQA